MKKTFTLVELVIVLVILGCIVAGVAVSTQGCSGGVETGKSTKVEMEQTEVNHRKLVKAIPPPALTTSQERLNLKRRLERFNNENKVSYVYLISHGQVLGFFTIKGKVSSVNSMLTTPDQIVTMGSAGSIGADGKISRHVVKSPDLDGSYGTNGDAVFFFTTSDAYVEWAGEYMWCDQPLQLSTPPLVVINEDAEGPEKK